MWSSDKTISWLLRIGIAFSFLYPPIAAFLHPDNWIWFVPDFVEIVASKTVFLHTFGVFEILIAIGVIFMKNPTIPAILAALVLFAIIILDWQAFDAVFRDVAILLGALALVVLHQKKPSKAIIMN